MCLPAVCLQHLQCLSSIEYTTLLNMQQLYCCLCTGTIKMSTTRAFVWFVVCVCIFFDRPLSRIIQRLSPFHIHIQPYIKNQSSHCCATTKTYQRIRLPVDYTQWHGAIICQTITTITTTTALCILVPIPSCAGAIHTRCLRIYQGIEQAGKKKNAARIDLVDLRASIRIDRRGAFFFFKFL